MSEQQDLKDLVMQTDEEYHQLATQHHELDDRLHQLTDKPYLSRTRTARRGQPEEAEAPAQGPHGGHPAPSAAGTGGIAERSRSAAAAGIVSKSQVSSLKSRVFRPEA
jgi:hypothetical protein